MWSIKLHIFSSNIEIKDYNVMIDGKIFFNQPLKNDLRISDNIWKIKTGQGNDYITGCLLDYPYFENYYKLIAKYLKQTTKTRCWSKINATN